MQKESQGHTAQEEPQGQAAQEEQLGQAARVEVAVWQWGLGPLVPRSLLQRQTADVAVH